MGAHRSVPDVTAVQRLVVCDSQELLRRHSEGEKRTRTYTRSTAWIRRAASEPDAFDWEGLQPTTAYQPPHGEILAPEILRRPQLHEIAEALDIPKSTVMLSCLHLARKALARQLNEERP